MAEVKVEVEQRQLATAFSDLVLCVASIYSIIISKDEARHSSIGFLIFACASGLGTVRFSVLFPGYQGPISKLHQYLSLLGSCSGLPLLAASYWKQSYYQWVNILFLMMAICGPLIHALGLATARLIRDVGSTLSVLSILAVLLISRDSGLNTSACGGSVLFIIAGVIGTEGKGFLGFSNVDWFHYTLAGAVLALANGLR